MKAQTKDAVALAMDWLAQLREEDGAESPPGDNKPAIHGASAAGDFGDVPSEAPATGEWGAAPSAGEWDAAPPAPPAGVFSDAATAGPSAGEWAAAPPAPAAADSRDAAPAVPPAVWEDARPAVPPAVEWGYVAPAAPYAFDWEFVAPAAPPAADWGDARPAATDFGNAGQATQPAAGSWHAAAPPAADWEDAAPAVPPGTTSPRRAGMKADIEITERAAIGDELRIPHAWCEMGSCISHYTDPAALGEADIRTRAIAAGWRADALGRLACPQCQQGDSWFWTAHPVALWDRDTAVAMTTLLAAAMREITGADGAAGMERGSLPGGEPGPTPGGEPGPIPGGEPGPIPGKVPGPRPEMARQPGRGRHRGHPAHPDRAQ